ncbi:MAG: hypothetical protein HRT87_07190 [Legionellales bacterium]|nr:hypothetical protein [Legionellales bacterium]
MGDFKADWMHGYEKEVHKFDNLCLKAGAVLGKVTQCGIAEVDRMGGMFIVGNRPDFGKEYLEKEGYIYDSHLTFSENMPEEQGEVKIFQDREEYNLFFGNRNSLFKKKYDLYCGFSYKVKIDNDTQQIYWFASDNSKIYNELINNLNIFKKFIKYFKSENKDTMNYFRERKFKISDVKDNYFENTQNVLSYERDKFNKLLQGIGALKDEQNISEIEWKFIKYLKGGIQINKIAKFLDISNKEIQEHFSSIKLKLNISTTNELIDFIS